MDHTLHLDQLSVQYISVWFSSRLTALVIMPSNDTNIYFYVNFSTKLFLIILLRFIEV
jgi:hypothetical protein